MHAPLAHRIESALVAIVVFAALAFAPFCQAQAQNTSERSYTAAQASTKTTLDADEPSETNEPAQVVYQGVGVAKRAETQGQGWGEWTDATTVGNAGGPGITAIELKLTGLQGLSGSIQYQTYVRDAGWKEAVVDGTSSGSATSVEAVRIKLTDDIASHYDVLYRANMSGSGWGAWMKNNGIAGAVNKGKSVLALQVKLSPKTEEACGKAISKIGVMYEARFKSSGWQAWKHDGQTAGKGSSRLSGIAMVVDAGKLSGGIKYRAYSKAGGWKGWKTNGACATVTGSRIEAVKVKLTGALSKKYDVFYRAYVQGVGWLAWAKNGAAAGSTGYNKNLGAFQVKLVKKGGKAPGATKYPTLNKKEQSKTLNGIDIASHQAGINVRNVKANFVIVKATGGTKYVNPYYQEFADAALASGKELGFYHYAREDYCPGSAAKEAAHFVSKVKPYLGKATLFLDFEGSALNMPNAVKWAKKFMDVVYKKTGVRPMIYISQSVTWQFDWSSVAGKYKLWVAQYLYANQYRNGYIKNPTHWDIGYWSRETVYQYSSTAHIKGYGGYLDVNKFRGGKLTWRKLAQKS